MCTTGLPHPRPLAWFLVLSAADSFLTWHLVGHAGGRVYESNPVAGACLAAFGWPGLFVYKGVMVALVIALVARIARSHPKAAAGVLRFGCLVLAAVVLYSCGLSGRFLGRAGAAVATAVPADEQQLAARERRLEEQLRRSEECLRLQERLGKELAAGRCTLPEATDRLARSPSGRDPDWQGRLRKYYPGCSMRECFAVHVIRNALDRANGSTGRDRLVARLAAEFEATFGRPSPVPLCRPGCADGRHGRP